MKRFIAVASLLVLSGCSNDGATDDNLGGNGGEEPSGGTGESGGKKGSGGEGGEGREGVGGKSPGGGGAASGGKNGSGGDSDSGGGSADGGAGGEQSDVVPCLSETDCEAMTVAKAKGCAIVDCTRKKNGHCTLLAADPDGDGAPMECSSADKRVTVYQSRKSWIVREEDWDCQPFDGEVFPRAWDGPGGDKHDSCDGIDNDCDYETDDDMTEDRASCAACKRGQRRYCTSVGVNQVWNQFLADHYWDEPRGELPGICKFGLTECNEQGKWGPCLNAIGPDDEICSSLNEDRNCDGVDAIDQLDLVRADTKEEFLCDNDQDGQLPPSPIAARGCRGAEDKITIDCEDWVLSSEVDEDEKLDCDDQNSSTGFGFAEHCDGIDTDCGGEAADTSEFEGDIIFPQGAHNVLGYSCTGAGPAIVVSCVPGYENCDGSAWSGLTSGCETNIRTIENCGGCGAGCDFACSGTDLSAYSCAEVESFSAGRSHTCAVLTDGRVSCWGGGLVGQLGDGKTLGSEWPVAALGIGINVPAASLVAAGGEHTCAIVEDSPSQVYCWGSGSHRQNATPNSVSRNVSRPERLPDQLDGAIALGMGRTHSCAVLGSGSVKCWGNQLEGRFGSGELVEDGDGNPVEDGINGAHTAFINRTGVVDPSDGGIGVEEDGAGGDNSSEPAIPFSAAEQVAAGTRHTCALQGGLVFCAGDNSNFQLGLGSDNDSPQSLYFVQVPGLDSVSQIGAGADFTCALRLGRVLCWGNNDVEQIGVPYDDEFPYVSEPFEIPELTGVTDLAVGGAFVCALADGEVSCWGQGSEGQLGRIEGEPEEFYSRIPTPIGALSGATAIRAGNNHACALLDGVLHCWGGNSYGQLGRGNLDQNPHPDPSAVQPLGSSAL